MIIKLTQGKIASVSRKDYHFLNQWKWFVSSFNGRYYAATGQGKNRRRMHRVIAERCGLDISGQIDHRDGDSLNNVRSNLRPATQVQNSQNRGKPKNNTSGYKGVSWCKQCAKWRAVIQVSGKQKSLGRFTSKQQAAQTYRKAAKDSHGEFAKC